ncbi:hypothetical protein DPMN_026417 [Dreissena polymorpha]|uniref:Uncharacterized protein n=1 Tax=Dreissena polymorpha TaxID=45954 RepID=A0A9D4RCQ2_DREPO|nr:hypothetical protein DPMN_026417 [Dreissena polymorpha]
MNKLPVRQHCFCVRSVNCRCRRECRRQLAGLSAAKSAQLIILVIMVLAELLELKDFFLVSVDNYYNLR